MDGIENDPRLSSEGALAAARGGVAAQHDDFEDLAVAGEEGVEGAFQEGLFDGPGDVGEVECWVGGDGCHDGCGVIDGFWFFRCRSRSHISIYL